MKKLHLSKTDRKIAGVCGGIAEYFDIDPNVVRIIFVVGLLLGTLSFWVYIICWIMLSIK